MDDKFLGFTVLTTKRPFHFFTEHSHTRFSFLHFLSSIKDIPIKPAAADLKQRAEKRSVPSTADTRTTSYVDEVMPKEGIGVEQRVYLANLCRTKVRIVPYVEDAGRNYCDPVSIEEKCRKSKAAYRREQAQGGEQTYSNPFSVSLAEEQVKLKLNPRVNRLRLRRVSKKTLSVIKEMSEESWKNNTNAMPNNQVKIYKRSKRIPQRTIDKSCSNVTT
eukprot:TRINITY_DN6393_c0_g2_i1.p1 TRINITY_DN6393_c0_g2~~TRINITY_DN6393_c0_g2_i1.p1  ORF type:complete len:218 (+),score=23.94 TRINITY_DN6393_c0_g2_i1:455-1108(+)